MATVTAGSNRDGLWVTPPPGVPHQPREAGDTLGLDDRGTGVVIA
jgi:hypothetical protein